MKFSIASTIVTILGTTTLFQSAIAAPLDSTTNEAQELVSRADDTERERWCTTYKPGKADDCTKLWEKISAEENKDKLVYDLSGDERDSFGRLVPAQQICEGKCCISWSDTITYYAAPLSDLVDSMKECQETCGRINYSCWIRNRWDFKGNKIEFCLAATGASKCRNKKPKDGFLDPNPYPPAVAAA